MGRPDDFTVEQIAQALENAGGVRLGAAQLLKCSRSTITNYITRYPELEEVEREAKESLKDIAESKVYTGIREGDKTFVIFYLKTQGKDRGWSERYELGGPGGGPIPVSKHPPFDPSKLSTKELENLEELLAKGAVAP